MVILTLSHSSLIKFKATLINIITLQGILQKFIIPINNNNITLLVVIILIKLLCKYHGLPLHYNTTTLLLLHVSLIMICSIFLPMRHLVVTLIDQLEAVVHTKVHCRYLGMLLLFMLHYHLNGIVLTMIYLIILILFIIVVNSMTHLMIELMNLTVNTNYQQSHASLSQAKVSTYFESFKVFSKNYISYCMY